MSKNTKQVCDAFWKTNNMTHLPPYTLIRSKRKTLALQILPTGEIFVRSPLLYPKFLIERFLWERKNWIEKSQEKMRKKWGSEKKIYSPEEIKTMKWELTDYIVPRTQELWKWKNLPKIQSIKVTISERRWGSCSGANRLCFSYRLREYMENHPEFIDAVIIHELAHLEEKNHRAPFWSLVYNWMPEYEMIMKNRGGNIE